MCEAIYRRMYEPTIVRAISRRAIKEVVQRCCDRGPFDLIPRSVVERAIRGLLDQEFSKRKPSGASPRRHHAQEAKKVAYPAYRPIQSYEERIREYRARNPQDGMTASEAVQKRLKDYVAAKAQRVVADGPHDLPEAFTRKSDGARTVWIGLDFGTQNMKVAFRDGEMDDHSVLLELNPTAKGIDRFMLTPSLRVRGDKVTMEVSSSLDTPSWKHALSVYYGTSYASNSSDIEFWLEAARRECPALSSRSHADLVIFFTSLHLAFVLSRVGKLVEDYYRKHDVTDRLAFRVFMCAPVAALDEQLSQLAFQDALTVADQIHGLLDLRSGQVSLTKTAQAFDEVCKLGILVDRHICRRARVVPEVTAEIASYAQSRSARDGVYALVDIGAGTLDLNVFKILSPTSTRGTTTPIYAAACHPNGVSHLESLLLSALDGNETTARETFEQQKKRYEFPNVDALARKCADSESSATVLLPRLQKAHSSYCQDVAQRTGRTWGAAWAKRGSERDQWSRITMFLCGGGAAVSGMQERLRSGMPEDIVRHISHSVLPCPGEQEFVRPDEFPEEEFHRVAVAYGLTFGTNFEPYQVPHELPELLQAYRETVDLSDRFVSKDMV